ncbi:hypothetical protein EDD85DRAFT_797484 [Armillaria nabsnona]|nr:hypothetical protein EDD85DRAFT_797484 [Armillaria nabsnona]
MHFSYSGLQRPPFTSALLTCVHFQRGRENGLRDLVPPVRTMVATLVVYPFSKSLRRRGHPRLDDVVNFFSLALETGQDLGRGYLLKKKTQYISDPVVTKKTNAVPLIILIIPKMSAAILVDGLSDYWTSIAVSHGVHLATGLGFRYGSFDQMTILVPYLSLDGLTDNRDGFQKLYAAVRAKQGALSYTTTCQHSLKAFTEFENGFTQRSPYRTRGDEKHESSLFTVEDV